MAEGDRGSIGDLRRYDAEVIDLKRFYIIVIMGLHRAKQIFTGL